MWINALIVYAYMDATIELMLQNYKNAKMILYFKNNQFRILTHSYKDPKLQYNKPKGVNFTSNDGDPMRMNIKVGNDELNCEVCQKPIKTSNWYLSSSQCKHDKFHARCHLCSQAISMNDFGIQLKGKAQIWRFLPTRIIDDNDILMRLDLLVGEKFEPITYIDLEVNISSEDTWKYCNLRF